MPIIALFGLMIFFLVSRVFLLVGAKRPPGKVVKLVFLSLPERSLMQRMNLYAIAAVLLLMSVTGTIAGTFEIIVVVAVTLVMAIPVRCIVSTEGVGINNVVFRPWSDFTSFLVEPRRIVLIGRENTRPLNLHLLANHQKEVVPILRRHLPEAKPGKEARGAKRLIAG